MPDEKHSDVSSLKRDYGYARMLASHLEDVDETDLTLSQAKHHAERLSAWLEEAVYLREESS